MLQQALELYTQAVCKEFQGEYKDILFYKIEEQFVNGTNFTYEVSHGSSKQKVLELLPKKNH